MSGTLVVLDRSAHKNEKNAIGLSYPKKGKAHPLQLEKDLFIFLSS